MFTLGDSQFSTKSVAEGGLSAGGTLPFFPSAPLISQEIPAAVREDLVGLPVASLI